MLLFGPTGVGKTGLLFSLQERLRVKNSIAIEIISADSMQVYKGMDIGTAKPTKEEMSLLPHWCIDICFPDTQFDVGDFIRCSDQIIPEILRRGAIPVISGGTAFYFKHFIFGLPSTPEVTEDIRLLVKGIHEKYGNGGCMEILKTVDPVTADRIHINDTYRILRALEVFYSTGMPLSSYKIPDTARNQYDPVIFGLERPRKELYERIDERVDAMFDTGLADEVKTLTEKGYSSASPGMKGIGYREFFKDGTYYSADSDRIRELIKRNTRRYAKRQITFFNSLDNVTWLSADDDKKLVEYLALQIIRMHENYSSSG